MNIEDEDDRLMVPPDFIAAMRSVAERDVKLFFKQLKRRELNRVGNLPIDDLTHLQARVKMIAELEAILLEVRNTGI